MQDLCFTPDQLKCIQNSKVDFSKCSDKCEGMDVISYDKEEIDSEFIRKSKKNLQLTKYISKLSDQYNKYKGKYVFPSKYKGNYNSIWKR